MNIPVCFQSTMLQKSENNLASSPGHSQILSLQMWDKIWEWPGDQAKKQPTF